ncbi:MAG: VCBS repeat-containing protein [Candidatus Eisenbacteria bacterium]|uniref:VCBS repeat-containing protein n=1 Tax=Eiseniibacteriota bacterium TaxID=2212470 RepID=A0A538SKZ5_UNCEI|nr:MAG: VCBS repeat-containing protein [Candidatus Eisenbacteria bacterium]
MSHPLRSIVVLALAVTLVALALVSPSPARAECSSTALFHDQVVYSTGPNPHGATTGDFNGDGILDVAVACSDAGHGGASGAVWVLLGLGSAGVGNGTFGPATAFAAGTEPFGLTTGDFNHDAHLDLAVANVASGNVSILIGRGDGTFAAPASYPAGNGPFNVVTGDFNHDGIMDLALPNNTSATVAVLLGRGSGVGDGTFGAATLYPIAQVSTGIATGDFNGDGNTDLVATCNYAGLVAVLDGLGNGTFGSPRNFTATTEPFAVAVADFNEDGILDIAVGDAGFNGVGILLGQGSGGVGNGSFGSPTIFNNGNQCAGLVVGDWNQDGILDLAAGDGRRNVVWTFLGQGSGGVGSGTFGSITSYPAGAVSFPLTSGDFNEGGFTDLVAVNYGDASISILFSGCEPAPPPPSNAPVLTRVRDVPNDDGGFVFVTWLRSRLDVPALRTITGYRVWRRIHPESGMAAGVSEASADGVRRLTTQTPRGDGTVETTYWEEIATLPAQGLEGYGYTSPTTQDSM